MLALLLTAGNAFADDLGTVIVHTRQEGRPVADVTVKSGAAHAVTDRSGRAVLSLPRGPQTLVAEKLGLAPDTLHVDAGAESREITIDLTEAAVQLDEIVVATTRTERRVADDPTRVEVTDQEDVEEQVAASPGNVAELLGEAGGVRVVDTAAPLGSASVRIRGLGGRYTKLLSDGLPLFGLSTEGLAPLQAPPLDLDRVEIVKGVASALYGPTALGGVVNLVSRRPDGQHELLLNRTSHGGTDVALWDAGARHDSGWGHTLLATGDFQSMRDVNVDGWADLPSVQRGVLRPRVFWSDGNGNSWFGTSSFTAEDRRGGTTPGGLLPNGRPYRDALQTRRADLGSVARLVVAPRSILSLRGSTTEEWRDHVFGDVRERDRRNTLFGEAALTLARRAHSLVLGAALERDAYHALDVAGMDYDFVTPGVFAQDLWSPAAWFALSSSARVDCHSTYGTFLSPRVSALVRHGRRWNARLSGGTGVFAPTPFTDETEAIGLSRVRPITGRTVERGRGASLDLGGNFGAFELEASAFATRIADPVGLRAVSGSASDLELVNAAEPTRAGGIEAFARYAREPLTVTASYAYLRTSELDVETGARRETPLNPRHAGGVTVVWEEEDDTRIGLETYYTGRQALADDPYRTVSKPFVSVDALVQQRVGRVVAFLHGEDLNDVRQTRFDPLVRPTAGLGGRWTTDVWAPLEGRTFNLGIKWAY